MAQSYFIWNGTDCRTKHIITASAAPMIRGEERVQHDTIPGRAGDITLIEGEKVYNSYIQTVQISAENSNAAQEAKRWLSGAGYVTFSSDPTKKQKARIIGAVTLDKVSRNLDRWRGEVQFYCQPEKEDLFDVPVTLSAAGSIVNTGDVESRPKIKVTCSAGATVTIVSSSGTFTVTTTGHSYTKLIIDSESEIVTSGTGVTNLTALRS